MNRGTLIFLVLSLLTIVAGTSIFLEASAFQKTARVSDGMVTSSDFTFFYVKYISDDGVERTHRGTHGKHKKYSVGDKFKVFYQTDNPDKSRISDGKKSGRKIIIIGVAMLLFDLFMIFSNKSKTKSAEKFRSDGRKVQAEILGIETDMNITIMDKHPYFITCRWTDPVTGKEYTHIIDKIWKDPAPLLAGRNHIDVYIDREDPDKYFPDIEFLGDIKV